MKKIVIVSSSPRIGGNSDILCDQFIKGAVDGGNVAEKIYLKDKNIGYCTGCVACIDREGFCSQKDDMADVIKQLGGADVIVLATPVYFYTMCAQLKTMIDRFCGDYKKISNKEFYFIATAAVNEKDLLDRTFESLRGFTMCLENATEKGVIYGTGAWEVGDIKNTPAMQEAYQMGKSIK